MDISQKKRLKRHQIHEETLNITNHQRQANQNHREIQYHLPAVRAAISKKTTENKAGEGVRKRVPLHIV